MVVLQYSARFAEQISSRFADQGHEVTVYCRRAFVRPDDVYDRRVRRVIVPSLHQKYLDTWVSTFFAAVRVAFSDNDVVLLCNVANSPFAYIPRLFGKPVVLNVDGLDRKREKWKGLGAQVLHFCEWMSSFSSTRLVTAARAFHRRSLRRWILGVAEARGRLRFRLRDRRSAPRAHRSDGREQCGALSRYPGERRDRGRRRGEV